MMRKDVRIWLFSFFLLILIFLKWFMRSLWRMERKFSPITVACVIWGNNIIIPEKNLKETLEANGMNTISAISYQVINGKNGMPAFGGRLTEKKLKM
jgi:cytochrome c6